MVASQAAIARCGADRGLLLLAVGWILLGLAILTVATRIFFRTHIRNGINWDDHFVVASLVSPTLIESINTADYRVGYWHRGRCLPYQAGPSRGWKTRFLSSPWRDISRPQVGPPSSSLQCVRDWLCQDIRLSVCTSTYRQSPPQAFPVPLGSHRLCGHEPSGPGTYVPRPVSPIELDVEPQGQRHMFLSTCYLHRRVRKLWYDTISDSATHGIC